MDESWIFIGTISSFRLFWKLWRNKRPAVHPKIDRCGEDVTTKTMLNQFPLTMVTRKPVFSRMTPPLHPLGRPGKRKRAGEVPVLIQVYPDRYYNEEKVCEVAFVVTEVTGVFVIHAEPEADLTVGPWVTTHPDHRVSFRIIPSEGQDKACAGLIVEAVVISLGDPLGKVQDVRLARLLDSWMVTRPMEMFTRV